MATPGLFATFWPQKVDNLNFMKKTNFTNGYKDFLFQRLPESLKNVSLKEEAGFVIDAKKKAFNFFEKQSLPRFKHEFLAKLNWPEQFKEIHPEITGLDQPGVTYYSAREAVEQTADLIKDKFLALDYSLARDPLLAWLSYISRLAGLIVIDDKANLKQPVTILNNSKDSFLNYFIIIGGQDSQFEIVENNQLKNKTLSGQLIDLFLDKNSKVTYTAFDQNSQESQFLNYRRAQLNDQAQIEWNNALFGSGLTKDFIASYLDHPRSRSEIKNVYLSKNNQNYYIDHHNWHRDAETKSNMLSKGVLLDESLANYTGLIYMDGNSSQADGHLKSDTLLMGDKVINGNIPGLEIHNSQVQASHAATSSEVNPDHLFYCLSRGLTEKNAKQLMAEGLLASVYSQFHNQDIIEKIEKRISAKG